MNAFSYKIRYRLLLCTIALMLASVLSAWAAPHPPLSLYPTPVPRPAFNGASKLPDYRLYQEIFDLQENALWQRADRLIRRLDNPILMGHVLYQRYMHPTAYRARWPELRDWLKKYADHPSAARIYTLAQKRKPRGVAMPKHPPPPSQQMRAAAAPSPLFTTITKRRIKYRVSSLVRRARPSEALRYITAKNQARRLSKDERNFLKSRIARSYYIEGEIAKAHALAITASRSRRYAPLADWHAGLAAYRLGKSKSALRHFELLARNPFAGQNLQAKAAYWAARVLRDAGKIAPAERHFKAAAASGDNFYALLSMQHVADSLPIIWQRADVASDNILSTHAGLRRAQALRQAQHGEWAELELLHLQARLSDQQARNLLAYARENNYPAVQLALATRLGAGRASGMPLKIFESAYPIIALDNEDTSIDTALLFALIRQESRFKARAKSHAGARGLMQIMPQTAAFISGDRQLGRRDGRDRLLNSDLNLQLGQHYLAMLLSPDYFDGNLILAVAAYNAGPGNVRRWRKKLDNMQDPLLFIESVPATETRNYVQKVMRNMWIYRSRLKQEPTEHRILAAESWPTYHKIQAIPRLIPALLKN